jgi:hypothetical protein
MLVAPVGITVMLPNGNGLALVPESVGSVEPLEIRSDRADGDT